MTIVKNPCRHCMVKIGTHPRGLCYPCYHQPLIRVLYPSVSKFAQRGTGNGWGTNVIPELTGALPGTKEKVEVLMARAALGCRMWNDEDACLSLD